MPKKGGIVAKIGVRDVSAGPEPSQHMKRFWGRRNEPPGKLSDQARGRAPAPMDKRPEGRLCGPGNCDISAQKPCSPQLLERNNLDGSKTHGRIQATESLIVRIADKMLPRNHLLLTGSDDVLNKIVNLTAPYLFLGLQWRSSSMTRPVAVVCFRLQIRDLIKRRVVDETEGRVNLTLSGNASLSQHSSKSAIGNLLCT